mmetsp:Transcript_23249/g.26075  ORF Transcript_23249/g.26075 Transcript_23249/m.26075 type:complete len:86 (+) Transcript_23249:3-260(+)
MPATSTSTTISLSSSSSLLLMMMMKQLVLTFVVSVFYASAAGEYFGYHNIVSTTTDTASTSFRVPTAVFAASSFINVLTTMTSRL